MDMVLGVSMESSAVRMVLIEGTNADGVTVEEDDFEVSAPDGADPAGLDAAGLVAAQVMAALIGTREGAAEGGCELTSTGVTWTDPDTVPALRAELTARDVGSVMLVSPLLAAAALAQTVGAALDYRHIAMLFVEADSATLAVVDIGDGSIVDLHRQTLGDASATAELATMVAGLDAPGSRADGVFVVGCGVDIVGTKPVLEMATSLPVSCPEEPELALARGAALASANAPLFSSSTAALAYALDPGTGEVNTRALVPSFLDVNAIPGVDENARAYSALDDTDDHGEYGRDLDVPDPRRRSLVVATSVLAAFAAIVAALLVVSLTSNVRPTAAPEPGRENVVPPKNQAPATELPAQVLAPGSSPAPAAPPPAAPPPAAPPPAEPAPPAQLPPAPQTVTKPPQAPANMAPAQQPRRAPTRQAPAPVQTPAQEAPPPAAAPAPPAPPPAAPAPVMTAYLHLPFFSIPIPINPPPPPAPPAAPEPGP